MRTASICSATSRSSAGTVKKYWVTRLLGVGVELPPMAAMMADSWSAESPGLPRNIMCSWAWAMPGKPFGGLVGADQVVDLGGHHGREVVSDDDDPQAVLQGGPQDGRFGGGAGTDRRQGQQEQGEEKETDGGGMVSWWYLSREEKTLK